MLCDINLPGIEQLGSSEKVKSVPAVQVTSLLPSFTASELEHITFTTVPGFTGNCVVVSIVLVHSVFSPVQIGAVGSRAMSYAKNHEMIVQNPNFKQF